MCYVDCPVCQVQSRHEILIHLNSNIRTKGMANSVVAVQVLQYAKVEPIF